MFLKGMSKSLKYRGGALLSLLKIDTLKFILLRSFFFVIIKHIHQQNVIKRNKTVTQLVTILTKCFFPYLNPTSYLNPSSNLNPVSKVSVFDS